MGAGYTRQSAADIQTGEIIEAAPINAEFNQLQSAFDGTTGHTHDGTIGEGPKISLTSSITGVLPVANGGTGGINKINATTAPTATDDSNDGYIEGSIWVDVTNNRVYICVDSTVAAAIWQRYELYDAGLESIAGLTTAADKMIYTTASDTYATTDLTSYARTLLDDANASAAQTTLGVSTYVKTLLDDVDAATARGTLGLGSISTQASNNVTITGGSITGITDLAVADGGTGASTAANARTNLGLAIGTDVQAQDAELSAIAGLVSAADTVPYFTGSGTAALATFTAAGRALVDDADAAAQRTTLGLGNVNNTSDANKPVSTAQQAALDLKADLASPALTGTPTAPTAASGTNTTQIATTAFVHSLLPPGAVVPFAMNTAPTGWLKANGAAVSRTTYAALFSAIGTTFGSGDGSTTFNVPELRAEFVRGWDDSRGVDSGRVFGSAQLDAFQGHIHAVPRATSTTAAGAAAGSAASGNLDTGSPLTDGVNGTPRTAAETRPRNIALLYCIKT
jgi:microcystin-dependent protein